MEINGTFDNEKIFNFDDLGDQDYLSRNDD